MKVKIDIDCTPEEARAFLGLPDVAPVQEALMGELEGRLKAAMAATDAESLLKAWMPAGFAGWDKLQKGFWDQMSKAAAKPTRD